MFRTESELEIGTIENLNILVVTCDISEKDHVDNRHPSLRNIIKKKEQKKEMKQESIRVGSLTL